MDVTTGTRLGPYEIYSVSPDGQSFPLMVGAVNSDTPVTIVQHWTGLLRK